LGIPAVVLAALFVPARAPGDPASLLALSGWKLTLPEGQPDEIGPDRLRAFSHPDWFFVAPDGKGVVFRAPAGGATTKNSRYPRCELREMAAWSTARGRHVLDLVQAITRLPAKKPHVVAGQIHDATDDVVMIRLEGTHLFVEGGGKALGTLDRDYRLGTDFAIRLEASGGRVRVFYRDQETPQVETSRAAEGCYFKAGVYTQSNPSRGEDPAAVGEVVIRRLAVVHEP